MEKRVLLAVFLSFLVLYAYQALFPSPKPAKKAPAAATSIQQQKPSDPTAAPPASPAVPPQAGTEAPAAPGPSAAPLVGDSAERDVVVETPTIRAVFSNRGGVVTHWHLKHYKDQKGEAVDLIPDVPGMKPRPFSLRTEDAALTERLNSAFYKSRIDRDDAGRQAVTFEYREPDGISVRKTFEFARDGYVIKYSSSVSNAGRALNPVLDWGPGLGDSTHILGQKSSFGTYVQHSQAILLDEQGDVHRLNPEGVLAAPSHMGTFPFAGIDDHYFIATLVRPGLVRIQYRPQAVAIPGTTEQREMMAWSALFATPPSGVRFFIGPKDFEVLKAADVDLTKSIHFGIFSVLAVPLLNALKSINGYVGNYGWSIIILTVFINLLMFPLRHKSVVSMRKMQELQPQIKAIQDRYAKYKATDPERQKMNTELMALYKEKGANPASGCLPMLLTMPVLFAFYSLLSVAIEMRGAPFGLWIQDLSVHDPFYITPLIMAATMFWQQKLTPVADPAQAKVMMLTPVMFLFFFLWAPSGLVIYWTVSNLLGIGQQKFTNRIIGPPQVRPPRPPAERKMKSAGAGATEAARKP